MAEPFDSLLADQDATRIFLVKLTPWDPTSAAEVTRGFGPGGKLFDGIAYPDRIASSLVWENQLFTGSAPGGRTARGFGDLVIDIKDTKHDELAGFYWDGRAVIVLMGGPDFAGSEFEPVVKARAIRARWNRRLFTISLRDNADKRLDKTIQTDRYTGDGGIDTFEGDANLKDIPKPLAFGICRNVTPELVNAFRLIYQFHQRTAEAVDDVYDGGVELTRVPGPTNGPKDAGAPQGDISRLGFDSILAWKPFEGPIGAEVVTQTFTSNRIGALVKSGTAEVGAGTDTTHITDTGEFDSSDEEKVVVITSGAASGEQATITSVSGTDQIEFSPALSVDPDGETYEIRDPTLVGPDFSNYNAGMDIIASGFSNALFNGVHTISSVDVTDPAVHKITVNTALWPTVAEPAADGQWIASDPRLQGGQWLSDLANGIFRLGGSPASLVTADVKGDNQTSYPETKAGIMSRIATWKGGFNVSNLDAAAFVQLDSDTNSAPHGLYLRRPTVSVASALDRLMGVGYYWSLTRLGKLTVGQLAISTPPTLTVDGQKSHMISLERLAQDPPPHEIVLKYAPTFTVQTEGTDLLPGAGSVFRSGTATSAGSRYLTDSTQAFGDSVDKVLRITGGTGAGQQRRITFNTATSVVVADGWDVIPDTTSTYEVIDITSKLFVQKEFRQRTFEDSGVLTQHPDSKPLEVETLYADEDDAEAEVSRLGALLAVERHAYEIEMKGIPFDLEIGNTVLVKHPRWGLAGGRLMIVLGVREEITTERTTLTVWG